MAAPTQYSRQTSFALFSAENPGEPHSGHDLDVEFNAIQTSLIETQDSLELIQDDDGELARGSVGRPQLASDIVLGVAPPAIWTEDTDYVADEDVIFHELILYICDTTHTSSDTFDETKWTVLADFSATHAIDDGSITTAKLDDGAVTYVKLAEETPPKIAAAVGTIPCSAAYTESGGVAKITLTPTSPHVSTPSLTDGLRLRFKATDTTDTGLVDARVGASGTYKKLYSQDGYTYATFYDIQKNGEYEVQYNSARDVFILLGQSWMQTSGVHGSVVLGISGSTGVALNPWDGGCLLVWNPTTEAYRMVRLNGSLTQANLFNSTAYVDGVANQSLSLDTFYFVYVFNVDGANPFDLAFDFSETVQGVNDFGLLVKSDDDTRTLVGWLYTGAGDMEFVGSGPDCSILVHSRYNPTLLQAQTFGIDETGVTNTYVDVDGCKISMVVDAATCLPAFFVKGYFSSDTNNATGFVRLHLTGISIDGAGASTPIDSFVGEMVATAEVAGTNASLATQYGQALSIGYLDVQVQVKCSAGNGAFHMDLLGTVWQ